MKRLLKILRGAGKSLALVATVVALIVLLAALAGVFTEKVDDSNALEVKAGSYNGPVATVALESLPRFETAVGTIKAVHEASVASKLLARVTKVNVVAGQAVSEGDVLVELDSADLQARLQQAQAAQRSAEATLDQARKDYARAEPLVGTNAISRAEFDAVSTVVKTAEANLSQAKQAVEEARVVLDYATIRAPLTGVVVDKRVEVGDTATPGQTLAVLFEPKRMQLLATVRESLGLRLKVGDRIPAKIDALGYSCLATISEIVPEAESSSRAFTVKVTGPCPPGVYSGMFGRISIPLDEEEVLVVPAKAVIRVGQLTLVDVAAADGMLHRRSVRLGRRLDDGYEVLAGLAPGEQVALGSTEAKR